MLLGSLPPAATLSVLLASTQGNCVHAAGTSQEIFSYFWMPNKAASLSELCPIQNYAVDKHVGTDSYSKLDMICENYKACQRTVRCVPQCYR
jgi:hypothetical protein